MHRENDRELSQSVSDEYRNDNKPEIPLFIL